MLCATLYPVKFFVSSTADTRDIATRLASELADQVILAPNQPGTTSKALAELLSQAEAFVFLIGENRGPWVEHEWSLLLEESWSHPAKKMIPVLSGNATLPAFLLNRVPIRINDPVSEWDGFVTNLRRALGGDPKTSERPGVSPELRKQRQERMKTLETQAVRLEPTDEALRAEAANLEARLSQQRDSNDPEAARTAARLADLMKSLKQPDQAIQYLNAALESYRNHPEQPGLARVHSNMATLLLERNRLDEARAHLENAASLYRAVDGQDSLTFGLNELRLATLLDRTGDPAAARAHRKAGTDAIAQTSLHYLSKIPIVGSFIKFFSKSKGEPASATTDSPSGKATSRTAVRRERPAPKRTGQPPAKKAPVKKTAVKKTAVRKTVKTAKPVKAAAAKKTPGKSKGRKAPK